MALSRSMVLLFLALLAGGARASREVLSAFGPFSFSKCAAGVKSISNSPYRLVVESRASSWNEDGARESLTFQITRGGRDSGHKCYDVLSSRVDAIAFRSKKVCADGCATASINGRAVRGEWTHGAAGSVFTLSNLRLRSAAGVKIFFDLAGKCAGKCSTMGSFFGSTVEYTLMSSGPGVECCPTTRLSYN